VSRTDSQKQVTTEWWYVVASFEEINGSSTQVDLFVDTQSIGGSLLGESFITDELSFEGYIGIRGGSIFDQRWRGFIADFHFY
jgi:hypothetical protein